MHLKRFFFPFLLPPVVLATANTSQSLCRWEKSIIIYTVSIWTYKVRSIIQLLLLSSFCYPLHASPTQNTDVIAIQSVMGLRGVIFPTIMHALLLLLPAFSYQWLNTRVCHASTICSSPLPLSLSHPHCQRLPLICSLKCFLYGNYKDWSFKDFKLLQLCMGNVSPGGRF